MPMNYEFSLADVEKFKCLFDYKLKIMEYDSPDFNIGTLKEKKNKFFYLVENLKNNGKKSSKQSRRELF